MVGFPLEAPWAARARETTAASERAPSDGKNKPPAQGRSAFPDEEARSKAAIASRGEAMQDDEPRDTPPSPPDFDPPTRKRPRGFAAMVAAGRGAEVSEIARKGGRSAHALGTAHEWDHEEASLAGRKGGLATTSRRRGRLAPDFE